MATDAQVERAVLAWKKGDDGTRFADDVRFVADLLRPTAAEQAAGIEAAADAMERHMFAPHELPLDDELHAKYLDNAQGAISAYLRTAMGMEMQGE